MKRTNCLSWDQYFLGIALLSAQRSKDPSTQVGACIVNQQQRIVGIGYNGFPYGCDDDCFPWSREGETLETKYPYVVHAELNAILNSNENLKHATIYVSLFPCNECAKAIIQSGIRELVFMSDKYDGSIDNQASKRMLAAAGVVWRQIPQLNVQIQEELI